MKNLISTLFLSGFISLTITLRAQDLGSLIPKAHYSLINTTEDALGLQPPIELINAPFDGNDGIYLNGIYQNSGNPDYSLAHTPFMSALFDSVFAVQLEFRIEEIHTSAFLPVVVIGDGWRYLGLEVSWDSTFFLIIQNGSIELSPEIIAEVNRWYEITIMYDQEADEAQFFLDGELIGVVNHDIERSENDGNISNTNYATGRAFKGNWKNLRIFGSEPISATEDITDVVPINLSPNPVHDYLHINYAGIENIHWKICDLYGHTVNNGAKLMNDLAIDFTSTLSGVYFFIAIDETGGYKSVKKIIKN
jgi:hypothetical protein